MNSNSNKRKNRPGGVSRYVTDNRQQQHQQHPQQQQQQQQSNKGRAQVQGVYKNTHFIHAATALVGNIVQVGLRSGNIYEGIFHTFSPSFDVALELPLCIKNNNKNDDEGHKVPNHMIFPCDTVVSILAKDFDARYATTKTFATDGAISEKFNGIRFEEKELEPWDASGMNGDIDIELDGASNGWDPNEMFRQNEHVFGVQSTFDDSLSTYTVQLDKVDSDEFKEAEAKAEKLAAEIENNPIYRERVDLENGDEESLYAAVERPNSALESERESQRERDRERELEREREREKDCEREREREREHERERERDREREREERARNKRTSSAVNTGSGTYESREIMTERYITKPTRSITGPPPPVAMASTNTITSSAAAVSSQTTGNGPTQRNLMDRSGGIDIINNERVMNAPPPTVASNMGQLHQQQQPQPQLQHHQQQQQQQQQQQTNSAPSPANHIPGGIKSTAAPPLSSNAGINSSSDAGNKYGGGSMMKRKTVPQGSKQMMRNTQSTSNSNAQSTVGNSGGNMSQGSNNQSNVGGGGKGGNYQSMSMQNQPSYQNYSPIIHGTSQYRNQSHMSGPSKVNGDSNANSSKPMPQRSMRQYQGGQSNSSVNYNDSQSQISMGKSHGPPHGQQQMGVPMGVNNSASPPLQSGGGGGGGSHGHAQPQSGGAVLSGPPNQPPPQPQRQMRNQIQDLRQFSQDFQLGNNNSSPPQQQTQVAIQQQQPQQQQHQQQHQQTQQHINLGKGGVHHPQPSVSPPQQQQQQQPQQVVVQQQQAQSHMPMQHVQQTHHTQHHAPPPQQQQVHVAQQQHYVPQHLVQQQQQTQQQQHVQPQHVHQQQPQQQKSHLDSGNIIHISKHQQQPPTQHQQQHQHQQQQPPPQANITLVQEQPPQQVAQQGMYHVSPPQVPPSQQPTQLQPTSPPVVDSPPQQPQQLNKLDTTAVATITQANNVVSIVADKVTTPAGSGIGSAVSSGTATNGTTTIKKTHVLNPSAKPFTPRSPSTPNPSRPHTPQTPVPIQSLYTTGAHVQAASQTPMYVMQSQQPAFQAPTHPQAGQQPRMRRNNYGPMATSQTHVSATTATGQPLLAAAPIQQFIHYQQTPHAPHFQSQPFVNVRMYEPPPQQLQFITQTPPSTTPSPGQPHQTFHPPPQPSPAGGGPQPTFAPQTQPMYPVVYPVLHPTQIMPNHYYSTTPQHPQQTQPFQILMQQHPAQ
ncbi:ataxin-2 homolog isoform X2 [Eurosta solidaginis]|uniref:ataxin-2 homolog isoform X2 n=1 Tax=Eurosta solidaginis TaxID=178769 RepID=UPI0035308607